MPKIFARDRTFTQPIVWVTTLIMIAFHIGAVVALFFFSWQAFLLAMVLWWIAGGLGVGVGYHRLLTHRGYKTPKWLEYLLTVCATLALEGGPIFWVATHRQHHQNTDKEGDPHSPREGGFWAHVGWLLTGQTMHNDSANLLPYVPDLRKDKFHVWISRWHWAPITVLGLVLLVVGGWKFLLWGIFFRTVLGLHSTWLVNSATHMWGSRRFATGDTSRNSFWVALLTFGEGWHNNHHAHPQSSRHGLTWCEVDLNWYAIVVLRMFGLVWDVKARNLDTDREKEEAALQGWTRPGRPTESEALGHPARVLALDEAEDLPFSGHGEQLAGRRASHHEGRLDCCDRDSEGCGDNQAGLAPHIAA